MEHMPTRSFGSDHDKTQDGADGVKNCPICIDAIYVHDNVFTCAGCRQSYHYNCYTKHIRQSVNSGCPTCRYGDTLGPNANTYNSNGMNIGSVSAGDDNIDVDTIMYTSMTYMIFKKLVLICFCVTLLTFPFEQFSKWEEALYIWVISMVITFGIITMPILIFNSINPALVSAYTFIIFVFITTVTRVILSTTYSRVIITVCMVSNGINVGMLLSCMYALCKFRFAIQNTINMHYNTFVTNENIPTQESAVMSPLTTQSHDTLLPRESQEYIPV